MKPRRSLRLPAVLALLAASPVAAAAQDVAVETILRRPLDEPAASAPGLGPTRVQGDFAPHLEDLLAQADLAQSSTGTDPPPKAHENPASAGRPERQPSVVLPILGGGAGFIAGAALQLGTVVAIERSVAHKRIAARQAAAGAP